jgi:hypothetical protein
MKTIFAISLCVLAGCSSNSSFTRGGSFGFEIGGAPGVTSTGTEVPTTSTTANNPPSDTPNVTPTPAPICDPLSGGHPQDSTSGLLATLTYIDPPPTGTFKLIDFNPRYSTQSLIQVTNPVYLNSLSKATSDFSDGFSDSQANQLKKADGTVLDEYFGLYIATRIKLGAADPEGGYQFALISDDGSVMNVQQNGGTTWEKWIDDDGTHPNRVACNLTPITFQTADRLPTEVGWFQGPRFRIALMLFWRTGSELNTPEPFCGTSQDDSFFFTDSAGGPVATSNYDEFLSRGWKMLTPDNFLLPASAPTNPCN